MSTNTENSLPLNKLHAATVEGLNAAAKAREDRVKLAALSAGELAYRVAKGARTAWRDVIIAIWPALEGLEDPAQVQLTVKGIASRAGSAYAGAIYDAAKDGKDNLWLRPTGKEARNAVPPEGMEEATKFAATTVGQYLAKIASAAGAKGIDGIPQPGEALTAWEARIGKSRTPQVDPKAPPAPAPAPAADLTAPAAALAKEANDAPGDAEPFVKAVGAAAKEASAMGPAVLLAFWQYMAAEAATWVKARAKARTMLDDLADAEEGAPEGDPLEQAALADVA
jgi:hypothetical protein